VRTPVVRIALDLLGGDGAPEVVVDGALLAAQGVRERVVARVTEAMAGLVARRRAGAGLAGAAQQ
jgi:fatty acid/phospholipid biosynthesis enzyme